MGVYLVLYFVSLALALILYYGGRNRKNRLYDSLSTLFLVLMLFFLLFALSTKDPIEELLTTVPAFWQFMMASLVGAFAIWRTYLNPLKERVIRLEVHVASLNSKVDTGFSSIQKEFSSLKEEFSSLKGEVSALKNEFFSVKEDLGMIKQHFLKKR